MLGAIVVLIRTIADRGIWVDVDFRFASPEWMCSVGLMIRVSQNQTLRAECRHSHLLADQYDCNLNCSYNGAAGIKGLARGHRCSGNECGISASFNFANQIHPASLGIWIWQPSGHKPEPESLTLTPALLWMNSASSVIVAALSVSGLLHFPRAVFVCVFIYFSVEWLLHPGLKPLPVFSAVNTAALDTPENTKKLYCCLH